MREMKSESQFFGQEKISKILFCIAPPVMLAQLIQALYNIVDSFFVGKCAQTGLTALSIIYPLQLLMIAFAVGTGIGINTVMAAKFGLGQTDEAKRFSGVATPLAAALWILFAVITWLVLPFYIEVLTDSPVVAAEALTYGRIVCTCCPAFFLESVWSKIQQAKGDMKTPMLAQILGAVANIVLDPILIFGVADFPGMGIAGAAVATVIGQTVAALVVMRKGWSKPPAFSCFPSCIAKIFRIGTPSILMQAAYTFYIFGLTSILAGFSDQAVTALGLYYKWQTFFFIPLGAMQTCIVPVISFNYAAGDIGRCRKTVQLSILFGLALMAVGTLCFECIPRQMLCFFSNDPVVIDIGTRGFAFIGVSFLPMVTSLVFPVFFQAIGSAVKSSALTIFRTVVLFVPLGFFFAQFGLSWFWLTFPITETLTSILGLIFYRGFVKKPYANSIAG